MTSFSLQLKSDYKNLSVAKLTVDKNFSHYLMKVAV